MKRMQDLKLPPSPRNYEIWYTYSCGINPHLNRAVDEILSRNGGLTDCDLEQIHDSFFSQLKAADGADQIGARVAGEIGDVVALLTEALNLSMRFRSRLSGAEQKLDIALDVTSVRTIIESLARSTHEICENNQTLQTKLSASLDEITHLRRDLDTIRAESLSDPLTGLGNRKFFDKTVRKNVALARELGAPMSLLMFDIDNFKSFNDNYGHLTGDQVLRLVAGTLKQNIALRDIATRYGGEEFAVVLPSTTIDQAILTADKIRCAVMARELKKKSTGEILGRITMSVGVAMLRHGDDPYSLIDRADGCLYAAKRAGRNRVVHEGNYEYIGTPPARVA